MSSTVFGQNDIKLLILDSASYKPIKQVSVSISDSKGRTNTSGIVELKGIINGAQTVLIAHDSYVSKEVNIDFPISVEIYTVTLAAMPNESKGQLIEVTRASRRREGLPTNVDVIADQIEPTASRFPSSVVQLLNRNAGVRVQATTVSSGGSQIRIRGFAGRHTQLLRDGFPLYGGLSGSLDLPQIPPLDLKQIEYVKGPASTFYGSGGAGGVINLVTKRPNDNETLLHENMSGIGAREFNAFVSKDLGKFGFTSLATLYMHRPYDADSDGYSDMPDVIKIHFSPKFYYSPSKNTEFYLGGLITDETRVGGDMDLINSFNADSNHFYFDSQLSNRLSYQFLASHKFGNYHSLSLKNSLASYKRRIQMRYNPQGDLVNFAGGQLGSYTDLNYNLVKKVHNLNIGVTINSDAFKEEEKDTSALRNQHTITYGGYVNYLWDFHKSMALELGLRADQVLANSNSSQSSSELFILPRLSTLFKLGKQVRLRLEGGTGYQMPSIFRRESEFFAYRNIVAIDYSNVKAERSYGGNFDINYQSDFKNDLISLSFDQSFYYTILNDPIHLVTDSTGMLSYQNSESQLTTAGFESQFKLTVWKFTLSGSYAYTDAYRQDSIAKNYLELTPQHTVKGDLSFVYGEILRVGVNMEYNSEQHIMSGLKKQSYLTTGIMAEGSLGKFALFVNFENISDVRQTRYESLVSGSNDTPQYTEIWAPLDGFFFNWGVKLRL